MSVAHRLAGVGAVLALVLTTVTACGSGETDEAARAAGLVPADAVAFLSLSLDPSVAQKRDLLRVARTIGGDDVRGDFEEARDGLLDSMVDDLGLDYRRDVEPWLGDEVAVAALAPAGAAEGATPEGVVILEADDEKAADAALRTAAAKAGDDVTHRFVEGHAVVGRAAVISRIAAEPAGGSLAESARFTTVVDELHGDRLLLLWADGKAAAEALSTAAAGVPLDPAAFGAIGSEGTFALDVHAESSGIVLEAVAEGSGDLGKARRPAITAGLPEATFAALTIMDLAAGIERNAGEVPVDVRAEIAEAIGFDPFVDVVPWMGGEAVLVGASPPPGRTFPDIGLVVEATDRAAAAASIPKIVAALEERAGITITEVDGAGGRRYVFAEQFTDGAQPAMALLQDRFILASSAEYLDRLASGGGDELGGTDDYEAVLGGSDDEVHFQLLVRAQPVVELIRANLQGEERASFDRDVAPRLESIRALGARAARDGRFERFTLELAVD